MTSLHVLSFMICFSIKLKCVTQRFLLCSMAFYWPELDSMHGWDDMTWYSVWVSTMSCPTNYTYHLTLPNKKLCYTKDYDVSYNSVTSKTYHETHNSDVVCNAKYTKLYQCLGFVQKEQKSMAHLHPWSEVDLFQKVVIFSILQINYLVLAPLWCRRPTKFGL